jgi:nucleotide-binding universal stress UspA family protein
MTYKDLLVVLDPGAQTRERVIVAADLAARSEAHLIGLYLSMVPESPQRVGLFDPSLLDPLYRQAQQRNRELASEVRALFEDIAGRRGVSTEWRIDSGYPADVAALHGRYADLIVLGQIDPEDLQAPVMQPRPEEVALAVGRPLLVVPYVGCFDTIGQRALIGWDGSREATRAINDAIPLLSNAESVTVLTVDATTGSHAHGDIPGADIALHLARHGIKARTERAISAGIGPANTLLSRASDLQADLLVMGAYGLSRFRELLLGGVTRTVLETMTVPVLMAH